MTSSTSKTCTSERPQLIVFGWVELLTGMKKLLWTVLHLHMGSWWAYVEDSFPVGADKQCSVYGYLETIDEYHFLGHH